MEYIILTGHPEYQRERMKIQCIKAFRTVTNMGLKEAKEAVDMFWDNNSPARIQVPEGVGRRWFATQFEREGFTVQDGGDVLAFEGGVSMYDLLKTAAILALDKHRADLAADILAIIQRHDI